VIRNAGDVAPKGEFVFRPATVDVEVLAPIDTSAWTAATLDTHVREVRNLFLRSLGQPQEELPKRVPARKGKKSKAADKPDTKPKSRTKTKATAKPQSRPKPTASPKTRPKLRKAES
jgi:putative phosphoserine phosphatase / 1-acylglycerol-3-phosphate O-acyltransferase